MVLKDKQLMPIQHIYNGKDVLAWLTDTASCYMVLPFVFVPRIHAEKAEAAYHCHRLGHRITGLHGVAARCSRIFYGYFSVSSASYLLVQLTSLNENITELCMCEQWIPDTPL